MTRILSECSASVRKSLQGLDYFAAEGARAFDDLSTVLDQALENGARKERVQGLQEAQKAGKLYLKGDSKVIHFFLYLKTLESTSIYLFLHPLFGFFWERVMSKWEKRGLNFIEQFLTLAHYFSIAIARRVQT